MQNKPVTTSKRLVHNTLFNIITHFANAIIGFLLVSFFVGQLGEERYGVWILIGSVFRYRGILSMGLNSAVNRYIPVYFAKNDKEGIQKVLSTAFFYYLSLSIVLLLITVLFYFKISSWFIISSELSVTASLLILIIGMCFTICMPLQLFPAVLSGLQRFDIMNISALGALLVRTALMIILMLNGFGLVTMGLVFGISEVAIRIIQLAYSKKLLPDIRISLKSVDFKFLVEMMTYGINTLLYAMGAIIIYKASDIIIGIFLGTTQVTQFSIASAAILLLSQFIQAFSRAIKPAVSDLHARDDTSKISQMSLLSQKYSLLMLIPSGAFLVVMGGDFLKVWVGDKLQDAGVIEMMGTILAILTIAHCLRLAQHSNFVVLVGRGDHKIFGVLTVITAALCVIISVICLKVYDLGLIAMAWSNFVPVVLTSGIILPIYFNHKMKISTKDCFKSVWCPALFGALPAVGLIVVWRYFSTPGSWTEIMAVVIASAMTTFIGAWFFSLSKLEQKRFAKILARR